MPRCDWRAVSRLVVSLALPAVCGGSACSASHSTSAGSDAGAHDASVGTGTDARSGGGADSGADGGEDAFEEASGSSSGSDAGSSSGADTGLTSGGDAASPVDAGVDSAATADAGAGSVCPGGDAGLNTPVSGGACIPGAQQCAGDGVETCGATGQWGGVWTCATGSCSANACAGSTSGASSPSCQPGGAGMTDCGAGSESCCTSLEVPGGEYWRTYTNAGTGPTGEAFPASVSGLRLDKYLVTVGRFRQFVGAWNGGSGFLPSPGSGIHAHLNGGLGLVDLTATSDAGAAYESGWNASYDVNVQPTTFDLACDANYSTWTATAGGNENLPVNCVNWYEAYAFCIWDGGFLPSEAEWEYAAAGGGQELEYPWGSTPPGTGNQYAIYGNDTGDCDYPSGGACKGFANIAPVGTATRGVGLWGQLDLAGDVNEWNLDWYSPCYLEPCTDCANLTQTFGRVFRGGDFSNAAPVLVPPTRNDLSPTYRSVGVGLRCARTP